MSQKTSIDSADKSICKCFSDSGRKQKFFTKYGTDAQVIFIRQAAILPFWQGRGSGLLRVLDWIKDLNVETIVPGHGPVGSKKDILEMREYVDKLRNFRARRSPPSM